MMHQEDNRIIQLHRGYCGNGQSYDPEQTPESIQTSRPPKGRTWTFRGGGFEILEFLSLELVL